MKKLLAGVKCLELQPKIGTNLVGYSQIQETLGIHDPICVRVLVLEDAQTIIALCSIEVCFFLASNVEQMRGMISERCSILPENIFFFATHTHAAPAFFEPKNWNTSPLQTVTDAVVEAYESRQSATIGMGYGQLQGYSINRRFMNRPVDPSISVIRIDTADGKPLSLLGNYGNHAVVMGYDNSYVSGDWPGYSSRRLESYFGDGFVAIFGQGGAGDVNPLTETVRQKLAAGHPVEAIGATSTMYGHYDENDSHAWNIGDRVGTTFIEAETIAIAYNDEVMRVWRSIECKPNVELWSATVTVEASPAHDEPPIPDTPEINHLRQLFKQRSVSTFDEPITFDVMLVGIGDAVLVGHPGETFSENAIDLRKLCQQMGIAHPVLVTYANGWNTYLTPENAYAEGGYEVTAAQSFGLSRNIQDRILTSILPHLQSRVHH